MTQRLGSDPSLSPGARFSLSDFTGQGYSKGRPWPLLVLWMLVSRCLTMQWWCPNRLRVLILRGFGARIGAGTLIETLREWKRGIILPGEIHNEKGTP